MIARLRGNLIEKTVSRCVIDVNGAGYAVVVPLSTFYELPEVGQPVVMQIHTCLRDDAIELYGFNTPYECQVFELMITVSGIGPKLAVNILSGISAGELVEALRRQDIRRLTAIPGVGKKTAERMVLELKDKVARLDGQIPRPTAEGATGDRIKEDALSALINLGYKGHAVKEVVERIIRDADEPLLLDGVLKAALRELAGGKPAA